MVCTNMYRWGERLIGYYSDEAEAAVDYARALFKYGRDHRESFVIDLNGVRLSHQFLKEVKMSRREHQNTREFVLIRGTIFGKHKFIWMGSND